MYNYIVLCVCYILIQLRHFIYKLIFESTVSVFCLKLRPIGSPKIPDLVICGFSFHKTRHLSFTFKSFYQFFKVSKAKNKTIHGNSRQFKAIQGNSRQFKAIQGNTKQFKAIQGNSIHGNSRQFKAIQGNSRQFKAIQSNSRQFKAIQGNSIHGNSRQFKAIQGNSRQFKAIQGNSRGGDNTYLL